MSISCGKKKPQMRSVLFSSSDEESPEKNKYKKVKCKLFETPKRSINEADSHSPVRNFRSQSFKYKTDYPGVYNQVNCDNFELSSNAGNSNLKQDTKNIKVYDVDIDETTDDVECCFNVSSTSESSLTPLNAKLVVSFSDKENFPHLHEESLISQHDFIRSSKCDNVTEDKVSDNMNDVDIIATPKHLNIPSISFRSCASLSRKLPVIILSSDEEDEVFISGTKLRKENIISSRSQIQNTSFLKSLSPTVNEANIDPEALKYRKKFHKFKLELTEKLYSLFNQKIFDNNLPKDMKLEWNNNLLTTAGCFSYRRVGTVISASIHLATKILDSPDRLRDTLIHEMCHAAVRLINGVDCSHGPIWQLYANRCSMAFPELKIPNTCHNYKINYKYNYCCIKCAKVIGRHSKSIDISKSKCPCGGRLQLEKKDKKL